MNIIWGKTTLEILKNHYFILNVFERLLEKIILKADYGRWGQQPFDFKWQCFDIPLAFTGFEL